MTRLSGHILTPEGFVEGTLGFDSAGRIGGLMGTPVPEEEARASSLPLILPGFIDLHVHGGGGRATTAQVTQALCDRLSGVTARAQSA